MKVYIGLGNPGSKYITTRHNIGFLFLDWLSQKIFQNDDTFKTNKKLQSEIFEANYNGEKIILAKPTTFMNLSGDSFSKIKNFYNLENNDFVIIYDDIDIDFLESRFKTKGSAGTHNGMRSIIQHANTQDVPRLRLGINNPYRKHQDLSDFVLSNFSKDELSQLHKFFENAYQKLT